MIDVDWDEAVLIAMFSLFAAFAGVPKLLASQGMVEQLNELGYSVGMTVFIGAAWTAASIGVWLKPWRRLSVLLSYPIIFGGIGSHLATGDAFPFPLLVPAVFGLAVLWRDDFHKAVFPGYDESSEDEG